MDIQRQEDRIEPSPPELWVNPTIKSHSITIGQHHVLKTMAPSKNEKKRSGHVLGCKKYMELSPL